jgi:dipeptidyl aminopeptidase/acylaminoacyl peptidase
VPSVLLPPAFTGLEGESDAPSPLRQAEVAELEALIKEARERQRRRRIRTTAAFAALIAAAAAAYGVDRVVSRGSHTSAPAAGEWGAASSFSGHGLLAYISRGSLLVLNGNTGSRVLVAPRREEPSTPQFSPNGRWLSFALGRGRVGIARADGSAVRIAKGAAVWLPNSDLLLGDSIFRVTQGGRMRLMRVAQAPANLSVWASDGSRYAFVSRRLVYGKHASFHGLEQLRLSNSLRGPRTLWHQERISFNRRDGSKGNAIAGIVVLPHHEGVLVSFDPMQSASIAADGTPLYEVRAARGPLQKLGVTVGRRISIGAAGQVAIGGGGDRYAWTTKTVETCAAANARCTAVAAPAEKLTLDPAWSPNGKALAFVAATPESAGDFVQKTIKRWYATRHLWLLRASSTRPVELPGTTGAAAPVWSRDGKSILYVANDALWLIPRLGEHPRAIAGPLFPPNHWPSYYGQIDWTNQFAWLSP